MPKKKSAKKMGRPSTRPHGAKKLQVYFAPETYADLKAGNVCFGRGACLDYAAAGTVAR